jgi:hypothetical protein
MCIPTSRAERLPIKIVVLFTLPSGGIDMERTTKSERLAISFPIIVAVLGFVSWIVRMICDVQRNMQSKS